MNGVKINTRTGALKRRSAFLMLMIGMLMPAFAVSADGARILAEVDRLSNFEGLDFSAVYTIVSQRPGEEQSVTQARLFRRDTNNQFVIIIMQPEVQRGQGYLQIEDTVWFYDPDSRRFERSSLRDRIQNTDAQNSDLSQTNFAADYDVIAMEEGQLGNFPVYIMDLRAKRSDVTYDAVRLWVRRDVNIVLREENFSVNGRLLRTVLYPRYSTFAERFLPTQVLIIDAVNVGQRTQLTVSSPSIERIPDFVFSRQYLERVNN